MSASLFADDALRAAKLALDGLSARQQVISRNLANVDTPGYSAQQVDFESTLKTALNKQSGNVQMARTSALHIKPSESSSSFYSNTNRAGGSYRKDGNNVDVDTELLEMTTTGIKYQAISQGISKKLLLLKSIAQGG